VIASGALLLLACVGGETPLAGRWSGSLQMGGRALAMQGWIEEDGEAVEAVLHVPPLGAMALAFAGRRAADALRIAATVEGRPLELEGTPDARRWSGTWSWAGQGGTFELERTGDLPPPYEELPVVFQSGDVELAGTILLPSGPGPFAAVVWTHGSGGIGRKSTSYVREPYALALAGVASLVYDKRGVGESTGDWRTASFEDLARDAVAARRELLALDRVDPGRIDPGRIGVGGISQASSWIAPIACTLDPDFAFALVLSATARTAAEQHTWVVECRLRDAGFGDEAVERAIDLHRRVDDWQREGGERAELDAELELLNEEPWFATALLPTKVAPYPDHVRRWMWLDPLPIWEATSVPAFGCWGAADRITDPSVSRPLLERTLGERLTSHVLPGAGHELFLDGPQPRLVAPDLHPLLLGWLREQGLAPVD